jgi:hypothetical protein
MARGSSKMRTETRPSAQLACDLLVIGSGAGGLSAAVTAAWHGLRVIVAEKEPVLGGTTAWSGGWMWTPRNPLVQRAGIVEDPEGPRAYLRHVLGNNFNEAKVEAFLEAAPHMVAFFEKNTAVQFELGLKIPDTYGNAPGAGTGGRSVIAAPYDARGLGDLVRCLRKPMRETTFMGMTLQAGPDLAAFMNVTRSPRAFIHVTNRFGRHLVDLALHRRGTQLRNGLALIGRLLRSASDLGVDLRTSSPAVRLLHEGGAVCGAMLRSRRRNGGAGARRRARGRRLSARPRTTSPHVPRRRAASDAGGPLCHRRRGATRRVRGRRRGRYTRSCRRLVPRLACTIPGRNNRPLPAHHRARQAGHHRSARGRTALLQRGQRLLRLCGGHVANRTRRAGGRVVADLHARIPAALRIGDNSAGANPRRALRQVRVHQSRGDYR